MAGDVKKAITPNTPDGVDPAKRGQISLFKPGCPRLALPEEWQTGRCDGEFMTTINTDRPEGRRQLMSAMTMNCSTLDVVLNKEIAIAGVTLHPATKVDEESGEVHNLVRAVLHCADGATYQSFSIGVLKCLRIRQSMLGDKTFDPPARCMPQRMPVANGRAMFVLEWLD